MQRSSALALAVALLAIASTGAWWWSTRAQPPAREPAAADSAPLDRIADVELTSCDDAQAPAALQGRLELRLFAGQGIEPARVHEVESAARRYWTRHGLDVQASDPAVAVAHTSMFRGSFAELNAHEADAQSLSATLYSDIRTFLHEHAQPAQGVINVVIVRDIVHPSAAAAAVLGDLMGLTLAPALLQDGSPEHRAILTALELDTDTSFDPTIFLSERHLLGLGPEAFVAAVAHELGHALGLGHVERATNLMAPERSACLPDLDPDQLRALRIALDARI